jgi:hypothetical protein
VVSEGDECAAPGDRHAPVVGVIGAGESGAVGVGREVIASIEHVESGAPIEIRGSGLAGNGEGGVLGDKVTK